MKIRITETVLRDGQQSLMATRMPIADFLPILETMENGSTVTCYGYHTGSWLYVVSASGKQGFCHKSLLKKK